MKDVVAQEKKMITKTEKQPETKEVLKFKVDECKCVEEKIELAYAELDQVINTVTDAMCLIGTDFEVLRVNEAYAALAGVSKDEAVGKKCYELLHDLRCHTHECTLSRILSGEERVECDVDKKINYGITVSCHVTAVPFQGSHDRVIGIVENLKDVTQIKKTQEQLYNSQLLTSLGEMTAGIAHEVGNPLASILLYSELVMKSNIPSQTKRDVKVIHDEAKRAARIMTALLAYSRRVKLQVRRVNLHSVIKKVLAMRRYEERVRNIAVSTNLLDGQLYVSGNSSQLMQVFMNLMLNAEATLKANNGGNVVITTEVDGEWAKVSIADDGTGIPEENLNHVFYPFFTTKRVGKGTGLGLSVCYGIITAHNGLIRAENNEIGGATFTVELPLAGVRRRRSSRQKNRKVRVVVT